MKISQRIQMVEPSLTRKLFNMAKQYDDVIDLTLGDPDLDTPEILKQAGCRAILENKTHYSANAGLIEARGATARRLRKRWDIVCNPETEIVLTVGGMEALYLSLMCAIDPGDEVIVFAPYYVNYIQMIRLCGGVPIVVEAYDEDKGMIIDETLLRSKICDRTSAIIVNSPNNPTGALFSRRDLRLIARIAQENDLLIVSDEVYRSLIFDGKTHESILQHSEAQGRTVLIDSMSKEYCMTGWRIGFAYGPKELIANMIKLQENIAACAPLPSQFAMAEAYGLELQFDDAVEEFQQRRDFICHRLQQIDKLKFVKPQATFYLFLNIKDTGLSSLDFAYALLEKVRVAVVPGEAYGKQYADYVRIAFTKDIPTLERAVERIRCFLKGLNI